MNEVRILVVDDEPVTRMITESVLAAQGFIVEAAESAEMALDWGLIWKVCDDEALLPEARALAARLAEGPTLGLGHTKMLIQSAATNSFEAQLDAERDTQAMLGRSADYTEGVTAFLEKRKPVFTGR